ncbi:MAG TPA: ThuA domain-containing protein, partial [Blastocatellia bacterium]|nr:ThuA domain-containing protein [Blastocatellia bacterium]
HRTDGDFALAWCRSYGKGRVFYTALGHRPEVWQDERFQKHLMGGLRWAMGDEKGDATPRPMPH